MSPTPEGLAALNSGFSMIPYPGKDKLFRILAEARRCNNGDFVTFTGVTRKEFYKVVQKRKTCAGKTEILTVQILFSDPFGLSRKKIYCLKVQIEGAIQDAVGRTNTMTDKFRWINAPLVFRGQGVVGDKKGENDSPGKSKEKEKGDEETDTDTDTVRSIWKTASYCGGPYLKQPGRTDHTQPDEWPSLVIIHALPQYLSWLRRDMRRWFAALGHEVKIVLLVTWGGPDAQQDTITERWEEEEVEEQEAVKGMEIDGEEGTEAASTSKPNASKKEVIYRPKLQQAIRISLVGTRRVNGRVFRTYRVSDDLVLKFRLLFRREPRTRREKDVVYPARRLKWLGRDLRRRFS